MTIAWEHDDESGEHTAKVGDLRLVIEITDDISDETGNPIMMCSIDDTQWSANLFVCSTDLGLEDAKRALLEEAPDWMEEAARAIREAKHQAADMPLFGRGGER